MLKKMILKVSILISLGLMFGGCSHIASSTNSLTDDQIKSETSGALGYDPSDLTIVSKRIEGVNTYVNLRAKNKKEYTCIINGGNLLSFGMTNPPICAKKGEPINTNPFSR